MNMTDTRLKAVQHDLTLAGLKEYFMAQIDEESYSDESTHDAFEEFIFQLNAKVRSEAGTLASCGAEFYWDIYSGVASLDDPPNEENTYRFILRDGKTFHAAEAIIANIVYTFDLQRMLENYWRVRTVKLPLGASV